MFVGYYNRSIILTFLGLFCSVFGICFSLNDNFSIAIMLLVISGICDCFDGYVASLTKRDDKEKLYGVQLDSLVDVVSFGVFPIILSVSLGFDSYFNIFVYCIYLFCGITRLAYFNVDDDNKKVFKGIPITTVSFVLPLFLSFTKSEIPLMVLFLAFSFLFLFNIRIKKFNLKRKIFILIIGILLLFLIYWSHFYG